MRLKHSIASVGIAVPGLRFLSQPDFRTLQTRVVTYIVKSKASAVSKEPMTRYWVAMRHLGQTANANTGIFVSCGLGRWNRDIRALPVR